MNRIMGRAKILVVLLLILALGTAFFVVEYFIKSDSWVLSSGSPHIYNGGNIGCGTVTDREGILLLDMTGSRTYAAASSVRMATIHWLGDREGYISAPALAYYAEEISGFDPISGLYAYSGIGGQVTLTLSAELQQVALEAMGDYTGTVAVYNYQTGELLCAVTTPNYDPDDVPDIAGDTTGAYDGVYVNRFTQSTYTPGSIFKIVTAAAALETIPDILEQTFTCTGTVEYGVDTVTCEKAHGTQTLKEAFMNSCNCAFAQVADQLGGETLQQYAEAFGAVGSVSFDGITTASGNLEAAEAADVQVAWSAVGQHKDLINPCTYLSFVGAVANGGTVVLPHLVETITVGSKTTYQAEAVSGGRIMSSSTAETLADFMRNNVESYYGDENFPGLTVCAKSGTAEVGGTQKPNAMFTGFVTDAEYPLAFIVVVEDGGYGSQVCIPIIAPILQACKELLDAG